MKQTDFERLKQICEKEGFELLNESAGYNDYFFVVTKQKDIWEGVEFAECVIGRGLQFTEGKIYLISKIYGDSHKRLEVKRDDGGIINGLILRSFKPSTESAYVEQLKAEAFERFGEIKEGDSFSHTPFDDWTVSFDIGDIVEFSFEKYDDSLYVGGNAIYCEGKWATKIKKKIEVTVSGYDLTDYKTHNCFEVEFFIHDSEEFDRKIAAAFLGSKLEEYLNEMK